MTGAAERQEAVDCDPATRQMLAEVLRGLRQPAKELPCRLFYDARGSELFEQISEQEEYYPTRTELAILSAHADQMVGCLGPGCMLIDYGSGNSTKARILLDALSTPAAYVPVDISLEQLQQTADELVAHYPDLDVLPVCADFTTRFSLPQCGKRVQRRAVYFPGSTIGNFSPAAAMELLQGIAELCGMGGGLLIGVDLKKDRKTLELAYNDRAGVTARFNKNILVRINNELEGDFQPEQFRHHAYYNAPSERIEMHLVSRRDQTVTVGGVRFGFTAGESIHTESCYKYDVDGFADLARSAGLELRRHWTDPQSLFSVQYLEVR